MSNIETLVKDLVDNKAYIGTPKSYYFPKVTDFAILGEKNKQIIINPELIAKSLENAKSKIQEAKKEWKDIVIILDKEAFRDEVEELAKEAGLSFLSNKVPAWIFTNFETFSKRIHSMNKLRKFIESPAFSKLTKKEQLMKKRELEKLESIYHGLTNLSKLPDLVIVVDAEYNEEVIKELEKVNIPYIAIANTDLSRWLKTENLVVMNTNSYEAVTYVLNYLLK
jgi:small subunit ribosomal protein S2